MAIAPAGPRLTLDDFKSGTLRGAEGFFRVGQPQSGEWWWIDPDGRAFFMTAVAAVSPGGRRPAPAARLLEANDDVAAAGESAGGEAAEDGNHRRLAGSHFNTLGLESAPATRGWGMPFALGVDFKRHSGLSFRLGPASLPDVFDPRWPEACDRRARECCGAQAANRQLIGYFTDHELGWAQGDASMAPGGPLKPTLLQICLSLEPSFAVYHAAWEFVLAPHGGDLAALSRAWGLDLPGRGALRHRTDEGVVLQAPAYVEDHRRFSSEFARRYFTVTGEAIRRHDPNHLILGCRLPARPGPNVLQECTRPQVDIVSVQHDGTAGEFPARSYFQETGCPVLVDAFSWAGAEFTRSRSGSDDESLSPMERMHRRGRATLESICADPLVVGYSWMEWNASQPAAEPGFGPGLIRADGSTAREHLDVLASINAQAAALHGRGR